jgi:tetratricopeptide (TPR) repeat protein
MVVGGALLLRLSQYLPYFTSLNRALEVTSEGVKLEKFNGFTLLPWWRVMSLEATPDLGVIRIVGVVGRIIVSTNELAPDRTLVLVNALRSLGREHGHNLREWPLGDRLAARFLAPACGIAGPLVLMAALYFFGPGGALGIRCSVNSGFMQETFGTPSDEQGCVVLRVSAGAEKAGIEKGDLIIEMDGVRVTSGQQFTVLFEQRRKKERKITVLRGAELLEFRVRVGRRKSFQEDNNDPFFYYLRARWDASDKPDQAIRDYTRVIQLEPAFDLAYLYRGELLIHQGDVSGAVEDYNKALSLSPGLAEAYTALAYYRRTVDPHKAVEEASEAIRLLACEGSFERWNVDCAQAHIPLASAQTDNGETDRAIQSAQAGIAFYPDEAEPYYILAFNYHAKGDNDHARLYARKYFDMPEDMRWKPHEDTLRQILSVIGES